jgi:hypothetical protein
MPSSCHGVVLEVRVERVMAPFVPDKATSRGLGHDETNPPRLVSYPIPPNGGRRVGVCQLRTEGEQCLSPLRPLSREIHAEALAAVGRPGPETPPTGLVASRRRPRQGGTGPNVLIGRSGAKIVR